MGRPTPYDALAAALRRQLDDGRDLRAVDLAAAARAAGCARTTASRLWHHGTRGDNGRPGREPLKVFFRTYAKAKPAAGARSDTLRDRLLGQAERGADRVDRILADPTATPAALDAAIKITIALAGAVDKLGSSRGGAKDKRALPDAPPAAPAGAPVDEADIAAAVAGADENPEPRGYETEVG